VSAIEGKFDMSNTADSAVLPRHDYGTRILKRTGNLAAVMRAMGHKDVKTAMQYQHPELEIVRAALDQDTAVEKRSQPD
jgi:site-specific recombinase XerC